MNDKNKKLAWNEITNLGDFLKNKLPESEYHPEGRNPYAHVLVLIKKKFGCSYKDIKDEDFKTLIKFIEFIKTHYN
tara:strand:+ start:1100 stop:1327 length:228 start_codon:yes stop_codon:yes gene_type:complete